MGSYDWHCQDCGRKTAIDNFRHHDPGTVGETLCPFCDGAMAWMTVRMARNLRRIAAPRLQDALRAYVEDDECQEWEGDEGVEEGCDCRYCYALRALRANP